ncbi:MAG: ABC transporter ATP-binding protein [Clostridia bacterium]
MATTTFAIELNKISKVFGNIVANDNVNLVAREGEILALLGENGSGKTTLMNMISGIYRPDKGQIFVKGKKVYIDSPEDAKKLGIGMIHQHFKLIDKFSAIDNIWAGYQPTSYDLADSIRTKKVDIAETNKFKKFVKTSALVCAETAKAVGCFVKNSFISPSRYKIVEEFIHKYDFDIDLSKKVADMSVSEKQNLEIVKVLFYGAKILVLDEPTAVLTVQEIDKLFSVLRKMRDEGCAIIIITHKLNEVIAISDRVSVLRKGQYIGTVNTAETDEKALTEMMVGKKIELSIKCEKIELENKENLLEINSLAILDNDRIPAIKDITFGLRRGEILGVAGISGSGQKELCEAIAGLTKVKSGKIIYNGEDITGKDPKEIIAKGISMSFIPEDRLGMGLAGSLDIVDNMMLKTYRMSKGHMPKPWLFPFVDRKAASKLADKIVQELDVKTPDVNKTPVKKLSGGNVQKVLLGREIEAGPQLLITAYPVRGLDINSSYLIYDILNREKAKGVGIIFAGEDLDVMLELCDRIMVLCHGEITGIVQHGQASKEEIGLMMTGARLEELNVGGKECK